MIAIGCILFGILLALYLIRGLLMPLIIAFVVVFLLNQESLNRAIDLLQKNMGFIPKGTLEKALQQKIKSLTSGPGSGYP
jgi:hypothetical protein